MKHKLLILLALALGLASNTRAEDVTISSAAELVAFASRVNAGETSLNATLTDDIDMSILASWTPIGDWNTGAVTSAYCGHFDGQDHTITGFNFTAGQNYFGIFGVISTGALVENFSIYGTVACSYKTMGVVGYARDATPTIRNIHSYLNINNTAAGNRHGGILGSSMNGTIVVDRCTYSGTLDGKDSGGNGNYGGIVGYVNNNSSAKLQVTNCLFDGELKNTASTPGSCTFGGIIGYVGANITDMTIKNCLSIGTVTSTVTGQFYGAVKSSKATIVNSYYKGDNVNGSSSTVTLTATKLDANDARVTSGELCYLLNTNGTNWFQTIGTDNNPVPFCTSKRVYKTLADAYANIDGPVQIGDADDLVNFAVNINHGGTDWDAELTADIDMDGADVSHFPIGTQATGNRYIGTFDGQGHKISNLQLINPSAINYGMFVTGDGVVLKNFWLDNTCAIEGKQYVGLIARHDAGAATFEGLGNCANVTGSDTRNGGLIGAAWGTVDNVKKTMTIKNCWTKGNVSASGSAGAICGWFNNINVVITNCWTIAEVTGATSDSKYMYDNGAGASFTITNCYSKNGSQPNYTTFTDEQLANGELCYLLNGSTGGGTDWYQTLPSTDAFPYPYSTHGQVYLNGTFCPDTNFPQGVYSYGNTNENVTGNHAWDEGICSYCGYPKSDYITPTEGYYMIGTPAQLKWFAAFVNAGHQSANAKLANITPLDLTGVAVEPIGNSSAAYTGTFDGQGKSITGFSATSTGNGGLFGKINNATIKDFSISGSLTVNSGSGSGVIGWATNSTISGIHSTLVINVPGNETHHVAGVVGSCQGGNTVSGCSFAGTLTVTGNTRDCFGGVAGYFKNDNMTNCANYGTLSYTKSDGYVGGVVGYINNADAHITNSLATGTVTYAGEGTPTYGGTLVGRLANHTAANFGNNYWLTGTAPEGRGSGGNTVAANKEATSDQLASGEVAYKLGSAWYQTIGTDTNPVLDSSREKVLYVGAAGYSTFYDADNDWALSSYNGDAKAFIGTLTPSGGALHLEEIDDIPAKTAVVIGGTYYNKVSTTATADATGNILIGSTGYTVPADRDIFALGIANNVVGFYPVVAGVNIPAGKAYLDLTDTAVKEFLTFVFDDATGINEELRMKNEESSEVIFNLAGQRLGKMQKGINIVNGKKIMVK